jgi:hypothetical protein
MTDMPVPLGRALWTVGATPAETVHRARLTAARAAADADDLRVLLDVLGIGPGSDPDDLIAGTPRPSFNGGEARPSCPSRPRTKKV